MKSQSKQQVLFCGALLRLSEFFSLGCSHSFVWMLLVCDEIFVDRWHLEFSPIKFFGKMIIEFSYRLYGLL